MAEPSPPRGPSGPALLLLALILGGALAPLAAQNPGPAPAGTPLGLEETLSRLGTGGEQAALRWDPLFASGVFSLGDHSAAFAAATPGETCLVLVDSGDVLSLPAPYLENGNLLFPLPFVHTLKGIFEARIGEDQSRLRIAAIIIDPGHGGKDPGALGEHRVNGRTVRVVEKDITLRASRILQERLRAVWPDRRILLTRTGDSYPSLGDRTNLANTVSLRENEAILYISLHANASVNPQARGFEIWYLDPEYRRELIDPENFSGNTEIIPIWNDMLQDTFLTESIMIAQAIDRRVSQTLGRALPSRGIKAKDWFVVRNARMPSILIELGFVTNEADALLLTGDASLRNLVEAIYNGIADYIVTFEGSGGFTGDR